jgi:UDP-glucose 4-epimerase
MKIVVTGGAGFIGSHLTLKLLREKHHVTVIDDLSLGQEKFLKPCEKFERFTFIKESLLNLELITPLFKGIDQVWHLAANSDIAAGGLKTDVDLKIGTFATYQVLEAMRLNDVKEIIFSSTSAIYGEASLKPTPEMYGPLLPISFYGASKLACEALITAFAHNFSMRAWIFRFANIVGNHATHGAIHDFIKKIKRNPDVLEILGDGMQAKSYLNIEDCIQGMSFAVSHSRDEINLFNLASLGVCSVSKIADLVIESLGVKAVKKFSGGSRGWKGDVAQVLLDGSKLSALGFIPKYESEHAVKKAIQDILNDKEYGISD